MDIEALTRSRIPVRCVASKLMKTLEDEIGKGTEMSVDIIEETLAKLIDKELSLNKLDTEIEKQTDVDLLEKEIEDRENYRDNIITWKVRANRILNRRDKIENGSSTTEIYSASDLEKRNVHQNTVKLPRLEINKYDGNILKFNNFFEQFKAAIDQNESLSNIEKFNYLKSYLINDAEISIEGLALSSENYKVAKDILQERFGRKEIIIDAHMSKLLNLSPVKKSSDTHLLRKLYSDCEINIRGLQNLGIDPDTYNALLYPILMKYIPKDLGLEFTRQTYLNKENKIKDLLEFLKKEIECQERNEFLTKEINEPDTTINRKPNQYTHDFKINNRKKEESRGKEMKFIPTASAFYASTFESQKESTCIFCNDSSHTGENCPLSINDRISKLKKQARCFRCLKRFHRVSACYKRNVCDGGKTHHKLICDCFNEKENIELKQQNENKKETPQNSKSELTNVYVATDSSHYVYLQTLNAEIINKEKSQN